jgi:hypothetical protein
MVTHYKPSNEERNIELVLETYLLFFIPPNKDSFMRYKELKQQNIYLTCAKKMRDDHSPLSFVTKADFVFQFADLIESRENGCDNT